MCCSNRCRKPSASASTCARSCRSTSHSFANASLSALCASAHALSNRAVAPSNIKPLHNESSSVEEDGLRKVRMTSAPLAGASASTATDAVRGAAHASSRPGEMRTRKIRTSRSAAPGNAHSKASKQVCSVKVHWSPSSSQYVKMGDNAAGMTSRPSARTLDMRDSAEFLAVSKSMYSLALEARSSVRTSKSTCSLAQSPRRGGVGSHGSPSELDDEPASRWGGLLGSSASASSSLAAARTAAGTREAELSRRRTSMRMLRGRPS
mmetsp:Transcript_2011/g.6084  ORF Transcript_2011/g.6084 Transcript_2011/m.6084 type:complete len:265 (-) Transcript_2011:499-1293(-)